MSIQRITSDNIENFTLYTYPKRTFVSSSSGITGSVQLFARDNRILKDAVPNEDYGADILRIQVLDDTRQSVVNSAVSSSNIERGLTQYLEQVNSAPPSPIFGKRLEVLRFTPGVKFGKNTLRKSIVKNVLFPYYRSEYPNLNWAFTNYHTLNFFTGSAVPSNSALIYPAGSASIGFTDTFPYTPTGSFTFEFYINPRYKNETSGSHYKAGTVLHLSSTYCISLISGSQKDVNGLVDSFRIMLQLSHSADIAPSNVAMSTSGFTTSQAGYRPNLIFTSSEIPHNEWTHVAVRWESPSTSATQNASAFTGTFVLNGEVDTKFVIPSSSIFPLTFSNPQGDPDALFVGNYYNGSNMGGGGDPALLARFFNSYASYHEGLTSFYTDVVDDSTAPIGPTLTDIPDNKYRLDNPLNAEVHDIRIYDRCRTIGEIREDAKSGVGTITSDLLFYVPVLFVKESRRRDILLTPFQTTRATSDDPFNISLSFGVDGRIINLPNFTREFVRKEYPRLFHLTASVMVNSTESEAVNDMLYRQNSVKKGNLTVLPNDNGRFKPNFDLLKTGTSPDLSPPVVGSLTDKFKSDLGVLRYDLVHLDDLVSTSSISGSFFRGITFFEDYETDDGKVAGKISIALRGASPEDPGIKPGQVLTILDRTRDPSSNEVTFFDVSNLFYGNRIEPSSFSVMDSNLTGSGGKVKVTLKDNGMGGLYRADCKTDQAKWCTFGSIVYDEGLAVVTDPTAIFFGKDQFETSMTGCRPLFVKEINVLAPAGTVNSSSNPNWIPLTPTPNENETANQFVYITHVNLHDDNLNIIAKAALAQPIVKRSDDKYLIRLKIDY